MVTLHGLIHRSSVIDTTARAGHCMGQIVKKNNRNWCYRSVFRAACGKEAIKNNEEEFVDPLPEKLRATVVS